MTPLNRCSLQRFGACWIKPHLGMPLLSVSRVEADHADESDETYPYGSKKENKK